MSVTISPHATAARRLMNETAAVYTAAAVGGDFTVLAVAAMPVQLTTSQRRGVPWAIQRAQLGHERECKFDGAFTLPGEPCQLLVGGERWNVVADTIGVIRDRAGQVVYGFCLVIRDTTQ